MEELGFAQFLQEAQFPAPSYGPMTRGTATSAADAVRKTSAIVRQTWLGE